MAEEKIPGPPPSELAPGAFELLAAGKVGVLSTEQSSYLGVPKDGPYKPDHYRY